MKTAFTFARRTRCGTVSPGLQLPETRLSNSCTLSSGHSCRILERMYSSASGRLSLKKSPGVKTRCQEPVRDAGAGPAPDGHGGGVPLPRTAGAEERLLVGRETCVLSPKTCQSEPLGPPARLPWGRATAFTRFRTGRVSFPHLGLPLEALPHV